MLAKWRTLITLSLALGLRTPLRTPTETVVASDGAVQPSVQAVRRQVDWRPSAHQQRQMARAMRGGTCTNEMVQEVVQKLLGTVKDLWDAFKYPFKTVQEARLLGTKGENARFEELFGVHKRCLEVMDGEYMPAPCSECICSTLVRILTQTSGGDRYGRLGGLLTTWSKEPAGRRKTSARIRNATSQVAAGTSAALLMRDFMREKKARGGLKKTLIPFLETNSKA